MGSKIGVKLAGVFFIPRNVVDSGPIADITMGLSAICTAINQACTSQGCTIKSGKLGSTA